MVGTLASVLQLLKLPDGTVKVLVEGAERAKVVSYSDRADYYEANALVLGDATRIIMERYAPPSVLVVVTRRIGDVLLATPVLRSLKAGWPQAAIDVLVFAGTEGFLAGHPDVRRAAVGGADAGRGAAPAEVIDEAAVASVGTPVLLLLIAAGVAKPTLAETDRQRVEEWVRSFAAPLLPSDVPSRIEIRAGAAVRTRRFGSFERHRSRIRTHGASVGVPGRRGPRGASRCRGVPRGDSPEPAHGASRMGRGVGRDAVALTELSPRGRRPRTGGPGPHRPVAGRPLRRGDRSRGVGLCAWHLG